MINITQINPDLITMDIKMTIPQTVVMEFLQKKGYEIKAFTIFYPAIEEFLISEPARTFNTFTATKPWEKQCENTLYDKVLEKEVQELLKEIKK